MCAVSHVFKHSFIGFLIDDALAAKEGGCIVGTVSADYGVELAVHMRSFCYKPVLA